MLKSRWWFLIIILALSIFFKEYQKLQAPEHFTIKSEAFLNNISTGDVLYLKITGRNAQEAANMFLSQWNYRDEYYQVKTTEHLNKEINVPTVCSVERDEYTLEVFTNVKKWGESTCQSFQEINTQGYNQE